MANVLEQLALSTLLILQELGKRNKLVKSEELYKQDTFLSTSIHLHPKCASNFPSWKAVKSGCLTLKSHNSIGSLLSEVSIEDWQHAHLPCFLSASCVPLPTLVGHLERGSMQHHSHCAQGCKIQEVWYGTKIEKTSNTQSGYPAVHSVETGTRTKNSATCQCTFCKNNLASFSTALILQCLQIPIVVNGLFIYQKFFFHNMSQVIILVNMS